MIFVAGGIGQTPFLALGRSWLGRASYGDVTGARAGPFASSARLLYGVRTADLAAGLDDFRRAGMDVELATDDGSAGHHGYVTDLLARRLEAGGRPAKVVGCGPPAMLAALAGWSIGTGSRATSRSRTTWRAASASASAASPRSARPTARPTSAASASKARSSPAPTSPERPTTGIAAGHLMPTTIESGPARCSTLASRNPASCIQRRQSAPV